PRVAGAAPKTTQHARTPTGDIIPVSSRPTCYSRPESAKIEVPLKLSDRGKAFGRQTESRSSIRVVSFYLCSGQPVSMCCMAL
ncbi:hypothetical protein, partial [Paracoccus liaowanqingii]|uniref:hypothetical protein n=1 Tax=Paracoccus liaowanqingii TaxID=2560053 RepID=UPI00197F5402